ncbi:hypothetical protein B0O40_0019 [Ruminococcaceae bacterium R-25]|nr:hypothetical protein B0O40_0019 [Ruminococcaceae bacterium R-25]SUQ10668.1 hypothetical protein SAMN06297423_0019 [Oscillospiraceae bacterium]
MENIKNLFVYFRNALAFSYSWLVVCAMLISLAGGGVNLNTLMLVKILVLCAWGSACFVFAFFTKLMKKKGFVFDLTVFFLTFIPVEILMFYWMNIFSGAGTMKLWIILGIFVLICYATCILIDVFVMKKRAKEYTRKLLEYNAKKSGN